MKMKLSILVVCVMLGISTTFASAENEEGSNVNIDKHTCCQINIFNNPDGAEIRFLQIEKSVTNNIYTGQLIITNLSELGYETIDLETILAEMELLLGEIQAVDVNDSEAVYLFVELKQDAIDLSNEFREVLNQLLDDETRTALQEAINNKVCEKAQGLQSSIQNKVKLYNGEQLKEIFRILGDSNSKDLQMYKNGTLSLVQFKHKLAFHAGQLNNEEKFNLLIQIKSENIKFKIQSRVNIQNVSSEYGYRKCARLQNRLNNSENMGNETLKIRLQQRLRLRINQSSDGQSGSGNGQGPGGGGSGSGNGQGSGSGTGSGSGGGDGQGQGHGDNNESGGGNGNQNRQGGGGQ
jgi:hypothetical protein